VGFGHGEGRCELKDFLIRERKPQQSTTQKRFLCAELVVKIVVTLHAAGCARVDVKPRHIVQVVNEAGAHELSPSCFAGGLFSSQTRRSTIAEDSDNAM
jgi:hypothetical protein